MTHTIMTVTTTSPRSFLRKKGFGFAVGKDGETVIFGKDSICRATDNGYATPHLSPIGDQAEPPNKGSDFVAHVVHGRNGPKAIRMVPADEYSAVEAEIADSPTLSVRTRVLVLGGRKPRWGDPVVEWQGRNWRDCATAFPRGGKIDPLTPLSNKSMRRQVKFEQLVDGEWQELEYDPRWIASEFRQQRRDGRRQPARHRVAATTA